VSIEISVADETLEERRAIQEEGKGGWNEKDGEDEKLSQRSEPDSTRNASETGNDDQVGGPNTSEPFVTPAHWKRLDVAHVKDWDCPPLQPIIDGIVALGNFVLIVAASQTGKTLFGLWLARKILQSVELLFGKYRIYPVDRVLYLMLEDPERRAKERLLDTDHEFPNSVEDERFILQVAPEFTLNDDKMFRWMESVIRSEGRKVVFLDTYQKATPGIQSFDDEKQGIILHKLANLTRRLGITLIIIDHFRKTDGHSKHGLRTVDDIKGTGGKVQNADCVILMERTKDRKQIAFRAFSKDFDDPVAILLNVSSKGSQQPKFTYAGDLDELASDAAKRGEENRSKTLDAMTAGEWISAPNLKKRLRWAETTVKNHLKQLVTEGWVKDNGNTGRWKQYQRIDTSRIDDETFEVPV
jgi:hypothetical protein